jgi:hypothetical protein
MMGSETSQEMSFFSGGSGSERYLHPIPKPLKRLQRSVCPTHPFPLFVEIIAPIVVKFSLVQQMEADHQDFVGYSHGGLFSPDTGLKPTERSAKKGVRVARCPGAFNGDSAKVAVPFAGLSRQPLRQFPSARHSFIQRGESSFHG